ncbi:hypothetical protein D9V32_02420 [Mycetocola tolaasinivorans]|uniref:Uncharacterized protein n=1 Tax=Mycetocola tolaasinivorans TaxID=76635 RepID=A0A3L7AA47_9MICO|nr:hypothetical protein [Mycetocola tolaasinivorans]RLP77326.1 hypothetical protein D9V32_02420 [Mycetocola tolaasinivorans]
MSISLYYSITRAHPITAVENAAIEEIVTRQNLEFPFDHELIDFEPDTPPTIFSGSTALPLDAPESTTAALAHWLHAFTELRRALPDADWQLEMDDLDIPWNDVEGYSLPGLFDGE